MHYLTTNLPVVQYYKIFTDTQSYLHYTAPPTPNLWGQKNRHWSAVSYTTLLGDNWSYCWQIKHTARPRLHWILSWPSMMQALVVIVYTVSCAFETGCQALTWLKLHSYSIAIAHAQDTSSVVHSERGTCIHSGVGHCSHGRFTLITLITAAALMICSIYSMAGLIIAFTHQTISFAKMSVRFVIVLCST